VPWNLGMFSEPFLRIVSLLLFEPFSSYNSRGLFMKSKTNYKSIAGGLDDAPIIEVNGDASVMAASENVKVRVHVIAHIKRMSSLQCAACEYTFRMMHDKLQY
jgi:hypothetical protein